MHVSDISSKCELIKSIFYVNKTDLNKYNFEFNELDKSKEFKYNDFSNNDTSLKLNKKYEYINYYSKKRKESSYEYVNYQELNNYYSIENNYYTSIKKISKKASQVSLKKIINRRESVGEDLNHQVGKFATSIENLGKFESIKIKVYESSETYNSESDSESDDNDNFEHENYDVENMTTMEATNDPRKIIMKTGTLKTMSLPINNEAHSHNSDNSELSHSHAKNKFASKKNVIKLIREKMQKENIYKLNLKHLKNTGAYKRIKRLKTYNKNYHFNKQSQHFETKIEPKLYYADYYTDIQIFIDTHIDLEPYSIHYYISNLYISESSYFTYFWNILLTAILAFYILVFPFENFSETWLIEMYWYLYMLLSFEYVFVIDIIINFFTSYRDKYGHVVKNPKDISTYYLQNWFFLDMISSVPSQNLSHFNIIDQKSYNIYLRILKLPKYLRIFRAVVNIFSNRIQSVFSIDSMLSFTNTEFNKFMNAIRYSFYFVIISNALVCYLISFTYECADYDSCKNWFFLIMEGEFDLALTSGRSQYHAHALLLYDSANSYEEAMVLFYNWSMTQRFLIYTNSYYFVLQTVTTVGYGDVQTNSTHERVFRSICMIIGVILFTLMSSSVLESTITESLNIYRRNEHEAMIEKLQVKYDIRGDPKKFLGLLGDSVYTENLNKELKFAALLPKFMCESVLKYIWLIYQNKMGLLQDESFSFFLQLMRYSQFRRCVFDEVIECEEKRISIVYSGQIGCFVTNLKDFMQHDYLYYLDVGEEMGYHSFIHLPNTDYNNYIYTCTTNSEIVEIKADKFLKLMQSSFKGMDYVYGKIVDYIMELYLTVALYYSMLKTGTYIDYNWYNNIISLFQFSEQDYNIMNKLKMNFTDILLRSEKSAGYMEDQGIKWYEHIIDADTYKYILSRSRDISLDLIISYEQLKVYKRNYNPFGSIKSNLYNNEDY